MSDDDSVIPVLLPGQTVGPFEIVIPREIVFYELFMSRTTRWERIRVRLGRPMGREFWERFRDWFEEQAEATGTIRRTT